jgi:hypothetical protein
MAIDLNLIDKLLADYSSIYTLHSGGAFSQLCQWFTHPPQSPLLRTEGIHRVTPDVRRDGCDSFHGHYHRTARTSGFPIGESLLRFPLAVSPGSPSLLHECR